ncbi:hypothetical protein HZC07_04980 [Candidatus Micrarchaeota archaeon]|nr:hypothetical protein [Candidatus Micrarchaeota archaeon]
MITIVKKKMNAITVLFLTILLFPVSFAPLPPVPPVGKACPTDIPNCCDSNWPSDSGLCCTISTKEYLYKTNPNCKQGQTDCRYSDTGELDRDCCNRIQISEGGACCSAFPDLEGCQPQPPEKRASRSKLTTNEGRQAYDVDYNALNTTGTTIGGMPDQSIYTSVQNKYQACVNQCQSSYGSGGLQVNPNCDSWSSSQYSNCRRYCSVGGGRISCPGVLRGCVQVIQNCEPVNYDPTADINACIAANCAKYQSTLSDILNARGYASSDWQNEEDWRKYPPLKPVVGPRGDLYKQFQSSSQKAAAIDPDKYSDFKGDTAYPNDLKGGLSSDFPYAKISTPIKNAGNGDSLDLKLQSGFIPEEAILTTAHAISDGSVTIEGSIPAPLWTTQPRSLFTDNLPPPDGEVQQYFKMATTNGQELEDNNPYKTALFRWSNTPSRDKLTAYKAKMVAYDSQAKKWKDIPTELDYCSSDGVCWYISDPEGVGVYAVVLVNNTNSTANNSILNILNPSDPTNPSNGNCLSSAILLSIVMVIYLKR